MPKVSVLTPVYNTPAEYLRECIESILAQSFTDFEFIILNDSPDNKEIDHIIKSYKDGRIKYCKNMKNIGISASRNKLLKMAKGEYIAIFDHDDISCTDRLEKEVAYLDAHPDVGVVGSWIQLFQDKNEVWKGPEYDPDIRIMMTNVCCMYHTSTMMRKSILDENDIKYEPEYSPCEDYRLWYRLLGVTKFYNFQTPLVKYRWFASNTSSLQAGKMAYIGKEIRLQICNRYPAYRQEFYKIFGRKRIRLFGFLPFLKIKGSWVLLFDFIPLFKVK